MSARIGEVISVHQADPAVHVSASRGGVELLSDPRVTLEPIHARNFAALLVRGADEVERMRARSDAAFEHVEAPWTADQVANLNAYQQAGVMHPFTGERQSNGDETILIATSVGWIAAPDGPVVQTWAYAMMADGSWSTGTRPKRKKV
jgi:hypothetical protein